MSIPLPPTSPIASPRSANEFIEQQLDDRLLKIEEKFDADAIAFNGPLIFGVDDVLRNVVEKKHAQTTPARDKLALLITTDGGYIEVVQRIVDLLRRHYPLNVEFIVPNYAYSAGTVLVMSGDAIHMDYYSRLGPIDPQVDRDSQGNRMVPALGYLEKYDELIKKAQNGTITTAEVQLLISGFDQAELHKYEQARELSITLLKEWLVKYKFKNWKKTHTRRLTVTKQMKTLRAASIARELNKTKKWHTHGYGISMAVLINNLKLHIDDFGSNPSLSMAIRDYHDLQADYMVKKGVRGAVHVAGDFTQFV